MGSFAYRARTKTGELAVGTINADSYEHAVKELRNQGYFPVDLKESGKASPAVVAIASGGVKRDVLADFFRQLADLLGAGVPLLRALGLLSANVKSKKMAAIADELYRSVESGSSLSESMRRHPAVFSRMISGLIHAGETAGGLDHILKEIVTFLDEEAALADKIRGMLAYPAIMAVTGLATVLFFVSFIVPKFADVFESMGQALPLPTRALLAAGTAVNSAGLQSLGALAIAFFVARAYSAVPNGRMALDRMILATPVAGNIVAQLNVGRFLSSLGLMLSNGSQILEALDLSINAINNSALRKKLEHLPQAANDGIPLSSALKSSGVVEPVAVDMARVGEETGKLPEVLLRVGSRFEKKAYADIRLAATILEPAIIVATGIMAAAIVLGMMLPILQINMAV